MTELGVVVVTELATGPATERWDPMWRPEIYPTAGNVWSRAVAIEPPRAVPTATPTEFILLRGDSVAAIKPGTTPEPTRTLSADPVVLLFKFRTVAGTEASAAVAMGLTATEVSFRSTSFLVG